jgi:hypothetical protein
MTLLVLAAVAVLVVLRILARFSARPLTMSPAWRAFHHEGPDDEY